MLLIFRSQFKIMSMVSNTDSEVNCILNAQKVVQSVHVEYR